MTEAPPKEKQNSKNQDEALGISVKKAEDLQSGTRKWY